MGGKEGERGRDGGREREGGREGEREGGREREGWGQKGEAGMGEGGREGEGGKGEAGMGGGRDIGRNESYTLPTTLSHTKLGIVDTLESGVGTLFSSTTSIHSAFSSWVDALKKYVQS